MNYRVVWRQTTRDDIYTTAHIAYEAGGAARSRAVADIELCLSDTPAVEGESRGRRPAGATVV